MAIKKAFVEIVDFLELNKTKKVSEILDTLKSMAAAKSSAGGSAFIKNEKGEVTHVFCYYHKMWEPVNPDGKGDKTHCEYGKKANTPTGLNTMCKEGTSMWTKQNREFKNSSQQLLLDVAGGKVPAKDIITKQKELEVVRDKITPRADKLGSKDRPDETSAKGKGEKAA